MVRIIISIITLLLSANLFAQGVFFSENREVPLQLNPAFAGITHSNYVHRLVLAHRRQGNTILGNHEFETSYFSYDRKVGLCNFAKDLFLGIGGEIFHDQSGITFGQESQFFHRQEINLNTSLGIQLGASMNLIAGLRTGLLIHRLSDENLTFDSQFDGRDYNSGLSTMETFENTRFNYFNLGVGLILRGAGLQRIENYELGISLMHINNKTGHFLANSNDEELGKEYRLHGKTTLMLGRAIIIPSIIVYKYGKFFSGKEWQIRPSVDFPVLKKWMIGSGTRISNFAENGSRIDALILTVKWKPHDSTLRNKSDHLIVGFSFDINIAPTQTKASNGYGGIEIFLAKYFSGNKNKSPCCPWADTKHQVFY